MSEDNPFVKLHRLTDAAELLRGVLWISGKPGVSKSALMAKLVHNYGGAQYTLAIPYLDGGREVLTMLKMPAP